MKDMSLNYFWRKKRTAALFGEQPSVHNASTRSEKRELAVHSKREEGSLDLLYLCIYTTENFEYTPIWAVALIAKIGQK